MLASRSVTLCDPARWIPACNGTRACCPEIRRGRARARGARIGQAGAGWGQHWGHFKNRTGRNHAPKPFAGLIRLKHGPPLHRTSRFRIRTQPAGRWLDSNKAHHHAVPNLTWLGVFVSGLRDTTRASAPVCVCHAVTVRRPEVARFDSLYSVGDDPHLARASVRFEPMLALTAGSDGLAAPS